MGLLVRTRAAWWRSFNSAPPATAAARLGTAAILFFSSAASDALGASGARLPRVSRDAASAGASAVGPSVRGGNGGMRTGVLIHGCHLGAKGWRSVMWGDEKTQRLGRLPHAVRLAWEENACVITIGTGASEQDGVQEGRYALQYLISNWDRLREFPAAFSDVDLQEMKEFIEPLLVAEGESQNTREELLEAGRIFCKAQCNRVILVSSPTHIPRCVRDACSLWHESSATAAGGSTPEGSMKPPRSEQTTGNKNNNILDHDEIKNRAGGEYNLQTEQIGAVTSTGDARQSDQQQTRRWQPVILASPCDTSYAGYGPDDLAIVEPPHRGDDPMLSFFVPSLPGIGEDTAVGAASAATKDVLPPLLHELVGRALRVQRGEKSARFRQELDALLRRYLIEEERKDVMTERNDD